MTDKSIFQQKLEERRRAAEAAKPVEPPAPQYDSDLIPEAGDEYTEQDQELDRFINSIDILDAYRRWCGKSVPDIKSKKTEGIMVSCPKSDHTDKNPSAWVNTDKQTWFCGGCQEGGDTYDIAAYHFGYPVPGYKEGQTFHKLRKDMAESYGYTFISPPGIKGEILVPPDDAPSRPSESVLPIQKSTSPVKGGLQTGQTETSPTNGIILDSDEKAEGDLVSLFDEEEDITFPALDWRSITPADTFLDAYMKQVTQDDVPEEYHFWNGLLALGFALGRDVTLEDLIPVHGNLFICTLGHSGSGKSKARYHLDRLLTRALPHKWDDPGSKGVRKVSSPGSAEALIHNFSKPIFDPANPKVIVYYAPIRGLVDFNELSGLVGRTNRQGNVTKPTLMQMYDMEDSVSTSSMTHGTKEAREPFASALTTTQPRAIRTLLTRGDADSGFLNRWIFAAGPEKERYAIGGISVDIEPAVAPLLEVQGWAGSFGTSRMQWSVEAAELFTKFFHSTIEPDKKRDESGLLVRMDLLMKKLILLLSANLKMKIVPTSVVEAVIVMYPYIIDCYSIPASQIGNSLQHEVREEILRHAKTFMDKKNTGISMRDLSLRLKRKKYPIDLVAKTLKYMCDLGELVPEVHKGTGRPTTRYKYVV